MNEDGRKIRRAFRITNGTGKQVFDVALFHVQMTDPGFMKTRAK